MIQTDRDTQRNNLEMYWFYSEGERHWSGDVDTRVRTHGRPVDMGIRHVDVEVAWGVSCAAWVAAINLGCPLKAIFSGPGSYSTRLWIQSGVLERIEPKGNLQWSAKRLEFHYWVVKTLISVVFTCLEGPLVNQKRLWLWLWRISGRRRFTNMEKRSSSIKLLVWYNDHPPHVII